MFTFKHYPYNSEIDFKKKKSKLMNLILGILGFMHLVKSLKKFIKFGPCELEKIEKQSNYVGYGWKKIN